MNHKDKSPQPSDPFAPARINRVRQISERGHYDRESIFAILDRGLVAHVAFVDGDRPVVMPMAYGRDGDRFFIHGAKKSRAVRATQGFAVSIGVTLVDGLVVARSIFESSMNYRSVVLHGHAMEIDDHNEKLHALRCISEHNMPGRWSEVRAPFDSEVKRTGVLEVAIDAASAKIRRGPPLDDYEEIDLSVWSGVVPMHTVIGQAIADSSVPQDVPVPASLSGISKG